jgi:hypothetical protein
MTRGHRGFQRLGWSPPTCVGGSLGPETLRKTSRDGVCRNQVEDGKANSFNSSVLSMGSTWGNSIMLYAVVLYVMSHSLDVNSPPLSLRRVFTLTPSGCSTKAMYFLTADKAPDFCLRTRTKV